MAHAPHVDLSIHHEPHGLSDHVALGFTKLLRSCADIFFATAKRYWKLPADATLRDVVLVVRADEAHHRDVNAGLASALAGAEIDAAAHAPCPEHAAEISTLTAKAA